MSPAFRELPDGARQQAKYTYITSEQRTEQSRLRRVRPISRSRVLTKCQNKSGTAEVIYTFVS